MIRLELWDGVRGEEERNRLAHMDRSLPRLTIVDGTWELACDYGSRSRAAGLTVPASELLIFACARLHGAEIESADKHFGLLEKLGLPVVRR